MLLHLELSVAFEKLENPFEGRGPQSGVAHEPRQLRPAPFLTGEGGSSLPCQQPAGKQLPTDHLFN